MLEKNFDYRQLLVGQYDFVTCQRPDGSVYGNGGAQCHRGAPVDPRSVGITPESWRDLGAVYGPETTAAVDTISANLELLTPEQRAPWEKAIPEMCVNTQICVGTSRRNSETGELETEPESAWDNQMAKRISGYNKMLVDGPPSSIRLRNGEVVPTDDLQPTVSNRGVARWVDPKTGLKYSHKTGQDTVEQTSFGIMDRARRSEDSVGFRKATNANSGPKNSMGNSWPRQEMPKDQQLDPDKILSGLSKREKDSIIFNGLSKTAHGTPQHDVYTALVKSPEMQQARLREVVERYAAQGGLSGVSGKPVALPGLPAKPGQERSSVDHLRPISTSKSVSKGGTVGGIRASHDNKRNFLVAEESLNSGRGERPWSPELDKFVKVRDAGLKAEASGPPPAKFVGIPRSNTPAPSPRVRTTRAPSNLAARREKDLVKLDRELASLREKRNRARPGSTTFQRYAKQVNEKATERRKLDQSPLN